MENKKSDSSTSGYIADTEQIEKALYQEKFRAKYLKTLRSTVYAMIIVAAVSVLIATLVLPVLQIYGKSMEPTFREGQIVICAKKKAYDYGDICAFYYNNKILVKRVIAHQFDYVDIDDEGNVYVNGEMLEEAYISKKALGTCNIKLPYQVPEGTYFVMGDNREASVDSRSTEIGCVSLEELVGKIIVVVWPFPDMKIVK